MELAIFGTVSLVSLAILIGFSILPFYVVYWIGRKSGIRVLQLFFPILLLSGSLSWAIVSYRVFSEGCSTVPKNFHLISSMKKQDGIFVEANKFNYLELVEYGVFQFVESEQNTTQIRRTFAIKKRSEYEQPPMYLTEVQFISKEDAKAEYLVRRSPIEKVKYWWNPPIFIEGLEILEKDSGKVVAKATELVFGGGLTGAYMRAIGGDQDFEKLSCGYASSDIGPWRPTLTSRKRFEQYIIADVEFLRRATMPPKNQQ